MKAHRIALFFVFAIALGNLMACSDSTDPINPEVQLTIEIATKESGEDGYTRIQAVAKNTGNVIVEYPVGIGRTLNIGLRDESGVELILDDPTLIPVVWYDNAQIEPGGSLIEFRDLSTMFDEEGTAYPIPAGSYTAYARFRFESDAQDETTFLDQEMTIVLE